MTSGEQQKTEQPLYPGGPTAMQLRLEAERQRRVPGIVFANGPTGRRARIAGTGIEVFEVIGDYRALGNDREELARRCDWLTSKQLNAALAYAAAYPAEIEARLAEEGDLEERYRHASPTL